MGEITLDGLKEELRRGARCILQLRHAERPKMDPDDPSFGDALHLTREGARTARLLGEALAEFRDGAAFCSSPLTRTRETAALVAEGMGLKGAAIPTDERLGNGSFFYEDPLRVLRLFKEMEFFTACFAYCGGRPLPGLRDIRVAADECEDFLFKAAGDSRLLVAATHDCYIAAFLAARGAFGPFSRESWPRFLDGAAILVYPDGTRRYELVRTGLSRGICGVRQVRAVVFDFGGVMTTVSMPVRVQACVREMGLDWGAFAAGFGRYRRMTDGGFLTLEEMYDLIWADADMRLSDEAKERIFAEDRASFLEGYVNRRTLGWMRSLKARGLKIGILTNMPPAFAVHFRRVYADFIALADAMVVSGEERMFKPQRRIYDLLVSRIGLRAGELCFVDDVEENCDGARRAGWRAVRFASNEQAEREFEERYA